MNKEAFLFDLAKVLVIDKSSLNENISLTEELYWDSLSIISSVISIKQHYHIDISGSDLLACETIGDIFSLLKEQSITN